MQLLSCARAWERLSKLLDELLLVCEVSKVRTGLSAASIQHNRLLIGVISDLYYSLRTE